MWLAMLLLAVETGWCCRGDRAELGGGRCQAREGEWGAVGGAGGPALCHSAEASGARGRDSRRVLADPRPGYCQGDSFPTERRGPCCPRSSMPNRWPAPGQEAGLLDFTLNRHISPFLPSLLEPCLTTLLLCQLHPSAVHLPLIPLRRCSQHPSCHLVTHPPGGAPSGPASGGQHPGESPGPRGLPPHLVLLPGTPA